MDAHATPDFDGDFDLDEAILAGVPFPLYQTQLGRVADMAVYELSSSSRLHNLRSNELQHSCMDQSRSGLGYSSRWFIEILFLEGTGPLHDQ